jgi:CubicO group peptidase (beta-lactamase class C family)
MNRHLLLLALGFLAFIFLLIQVPVGPAEELLKKVTMPITGRAAPELKVLDDSIAALMKKWGIPGGAVAVAKDGRLVFAHGYGLADSDSQQPVQPDSLFRIASVTKPITAAAILVLVEQGRLDLDAKVLDILKKLDSSFPKPADERWKQITVRQLLHHTAGFDRDASFDPMFLPGEIAKATKTPPPAEPKAIIRYMLDRQLDFDPGTKHAYSNFGYCLLGRIIEQVTGKKYEEAVRELVLKPAGIARMQIGRTRLSDRALGEVRYYTPDDSRGTSVFPGVRELVPEADGTFYLEAMDAHGAWIASPIDLVRFACAVDGSRKPCILKPDTVRLFESRPPIHPDAPAYYGLGWNIRPVDNGANWWHNGSLPGTMSLLVRTHHGMAWAAVFNLRPNDQGTFLGEMDNSIWDAVNKVRKWPENDLFPHD